MYNSYIMARKRTKKTKTHRSRKAQNASGKNAERIPGHYGDERDNRGVTRGVFFAQRLEDMGHAAIVERFGRVAHGLAGPRHRRVIKGGERRLQRLQASSGAPMVPP